MTAAVDALRRVPLFAGLGSDELAQVADAFSEHEFPAGSTLTSEGQRGARVLAFFVIVDGTASVTKGQAHVAGLGPGDYFGEIALLLDVPRTATVTADTDLTCLATSAWAFRPLLEKDTPFARGMLETMARRLYELDQSH